MSIEPVQAAPLGENPALRARHSLPSDNATRSAASLMADSVRRAPARLPANLSRQIYANLIEALIPSDVATHLGSGEKAAYAAARAAAMIGTPLIGGRLTVTTRAWWAGERALPVFMPWAYPVEALLSINNGTAMFVLKILTNRATSRLAAAEAQRLRALGNVHDIPVPPRPEARAITS